MGRKVPVPRMPDCSLTSAAVLKRLPKLVFAGSLDELETTMFAVVAVPFGISSNCVFPLVVLDCTITRLAIVALDISPVMRWAVPEKVRLPVETVRLAAVALVLVSVVILAEAMLRLLMTRLVSERFVIVAEVADSVVIVAELEPKSAM